MIGCKVRVSVSSKEDGGLQISIQNVTHSVTGSIWCAIGDACGKD